MSAQQRAPSPDAPVTTDLDHLRAMLRIRIAEEKVLELRSKELVVGSVHLANGQEAIAVGAAAARRSGDPVFATYRGHGWALATGVDPAAFFAELAGRATGVNGGRGGSAYFSDRPSGFYGENSIVGAGAPIACGAALATQLTGGDDVAICVFGDGALNQGAVHEAFNFAAARRLPVVFICENNHWSELTPIDAMVGNPNLHERAAGYGFPGERIDGNDAATVAAAVGRALDRARAGHGPTLIEAMTDRIVGHYIGDAQAYRRAGELERIAQAEPIARLERRLRADGVDDDALAAIRTEVTEEIDQAVQVALDAPPAPVERAREHVVGRFAPPPSPGAAASTTTTTNYVGAVNLALAAALRDDPNVLLFGEDVGEPGGVFGASKALRKRFGDRVFDTPISESAILGGALGASARGMRPIAEIMWSDFSLVALDQIVNQAANVRYVSEGRSHAPMTVRMQQGVLPGSCAQHSQSLEAFFAHTPGLVVGLPATPQDAYDMLRSAIACDDPAIVIEHRSLYFGAEATIEIDTPVTAPGGAAVRRAGADLTIAAWGPAVHDALAAADLLAPDGIDAEVIDVRWLAPLDTASLLASVGRTARLLVVHHANVTGGFGGEIVARVTADCFMDLDAPPARLGLPDVRVPAAPTLQRALFPDADAVAAAARDLTSF